MKKLLLILTLTLVSACDLNITGPTIDNQNTNTNTNTNNIDVHDIGSFQPTNNPSAPVPNPTTGGTEVPVNIPTGSRAIAESYANANPVSLSKSCQDIYGESAWIFMDGLVLVLKNSDSRWGYLIKADGKPSRDVIAYRATSDNIGAWGIDVIIDHCGVSKFGWGIIGFDPLAVWSATR
jgi:hypothetical protein